MNTFDHQLVWSVWRKFSFRFFFIYLMLHIAPWTWFDNVPGVGYISKYYYSLNDWVVNITNQYIFHVKDVLVPMGGSGDTSFGWAQLWCYMLLAAIGCIIWSIFDRKRNHYEKMDYWLRTCVRYYIASVAFSYGILKVLAMQMFFPNLSQLATPLGDLLPMRLSWLFIGYSTPYQVFSGIMEVTAALLLLNRKTITLGLIVGAGVFMNVMLLNLSYDIPVKIYSIHLTFYCFYLLMHDAGRLINFFIFNRLTPANLSYEIVFSKRWMRVGRVMVKIIFIVIAFGLTTFNYWEYYQSEHSKTELKPIKAGLYDVKLFVLNKKDTLPALVNDTLRWKDIVFEKGGAGSVNTTDTLFRQRYRRGYFSYQPDTTTRIIGLKKFPGDSINLFSMRYEMPDDKTIRLWTKLRNDSLYLELVKSTRHFQLAERQFHWLSEANR